MLTEQLQFDLQNIISEDYQHAIHGLQYLGNKYRQCKAMHPDWNCKEVISTMFDALIDGCKDSPNPKQCRAMLTHGKGHLERNY
jgi:predicted  nucleic acid-binding Zn ribbon protein